jgi:energy-coupling factor transport system permease protein
MVLIPGYIIFAISLFTVKTIYYHIAISSVVAVALLFLPFKKVKGGFLPISLFLMFAFLGNIFFHPGRIIYDYGFLSVTDEGLYISGVRTLRVFSMVFGAKILTHLLPLNEMIHSLDRMFRPLEKTGLPVRDFFQMMGLTLKAFPVLIKHISDEYKEIMKSKDVTGFRSSIKYIVSFMMPVFVKSIQSPESFFSTEGNAERN